MTSPPTTVLSATLAIFLVPAIAFIASVVLLRASTLTSSDSESVGYAAILGGLSLGSILPAGYIVQNVLPSRALLLYRGETDPSHDRAMVLSEFSRDAQDAIGLALRAGESYIPADLDLPREFVVTDGAMGYEFSLITDVILLGYPLNEVYALIAIIAAFTVVWGLVVFAALILVTQRRDDVSSAA